VGISGNVIWSRHRGLWWTCTPIWDVCNTTWPN